MQLDERDARIALSLTEGLGATLTRRCLDRFGSALGVVGCSVDDLSAIEGIGPKRAATIRCNIDTVLNGDSLKVENELIAKHGVSLIAWGAASYPKLLAHTPDPPMLLYVQGRLEETDGVALAIVGARKCTHYGGEQADRFAAGCSQAGLCIVSGGAYGIDSAAHHAALRVGGRTIAVIGSGLANPYPPKNTDLFGQIAAGNGAVISELPMTTPPQPGNFPTRNRIVSGLSLGVLVIEAAKRSGALITARMAVEDHCREVMALPGKVDSLASAGCHKIIREGWATLVCSVQDVLDSLGETGRALSAAMDDVPVEKPATESAESRDVAGTGLTQTQMQLLAAMTEPMRTDQLSAASNLPVHVIAADLTMLEIRGLVSREAGTFRRKM